MLATPSIDQEPEPTADSEPTTKTAPEITTEAIFVPEPEHHRESDQVRKPAPASIDAGILVEYDVLEWSPTHYPAAEGELCLIPIQLFHELENIILQGLPSVLVLPSSKSPVLLMV